MSASVKSFNDNDQHREYTVTVSETAGFPFPRRCPMHPPAEYDGLRAEAPISRVTLASGRRAWLLTTHEHVSTMLTSPAVSSNLADPGYPLHFNAPVEILESMRPVMLAMDPPVHTAQRKMVLAEFTRRQVARLRPGIQTVVTDRIAELEQGGRTADLVADFSVPVTSLVICELLGVPYGDRDFFQARTRALVSVDADPDDRTASHGALTEYFGRLLDAKRSDPGDDLLSRLVAKNDTEETLDHDELVKMANVLLVGGLETTANMIGLGVVGLLENPGQLDGLRDDPTRWPAAVDELLRFFSIADQVTSRVATADFTIGDVVIRAGEGVIGLSASANHDSSVFDDPGVLDVSRDARHHLAFGKGIHLCIGQNLARLELEVALSTLFERLPGLRLGCAVDELPLTAEGGLHGVRRLPVTW